MVRLLTTNGADLHATNSLGETLCHSLIRYSKRNLERMSESLMMCICITELDTTNTANNQKETKPYSDAATRRVNSDCLIANADGMTPLKLAADMGLFQIFEVIMNIEGVYCQRLDHDGLFVTKDFDIPTADQISQRPDENLLKRKQMTPKAMQVSFKSQTSILYLLMEMKPKLAFPFISFLPVKTLIQDK
ncbi:hypothetical protein DPMN_150848 [Dreissena polymorpha]|uniref:Uncharacterized protein n=1 Tax=Dreissena polymorpha TaxID=45954 RepID=A0A9D4J2F1_DREPO|nr:hypothetical protein DPMN_150848 [Dreissena polymorpha]